MEFMSEPVPLGWKLRGGHFIYASLSHKGVLSIFSSMHKYALQFTDLVNDKQNEIDVANWTHVGFFDDSFLMLTYGESLKSSEVEEILKKGDQATFKVINTGPIYCWTELSLIQETRTLVYCMLSSGSFQYNIDIGISTRIPINRKIWAFASLMGIDVGVKGVFYENGCGDLVHSLNHDFSITNIVSENTGYSVIFVIASESEPMNLVKAAKLYGNGFFFINGKRGEDIGGPVLYQEYQSIVRLYRNIFMMYNRATDSWVLVRIVVP
eukprot:gnl/Chilomastix_caulleri/952.p1 GENE.gnl/Chilomastix_caulleri/952~~gnl/Chilomastix_caulleri/952.p1  ORF type:complete len:267 (-),score=32.73 gnl/Chilomastix_caulleri/952:182-982(-)